MLTLSIIQTVVVVIGVIYGSYQVWDLKRTRDATSLETLLAEWRRCQDERQRVVTDFPAFEGTVAEQVTQLLDWIKSHSSPDELTELFALARKSVSAITDIGAYLESGAMSKRLFFGQVGTHILMLGHLLDPLILLTSANRGSRWGLRVRRVRWGANYYYTASSVHDDEVLLRDRVKVWPIASNVAVPGGRFIRVTLIPTKEASKAVDATDIQTAATALERSGLGEELRDLIR